MQHRIEQFPGTRIIGMKENMSFENNTTGQLWQRFMPRRKEIDVPPETALYSIERYPNRQFFSDFRSDALFEKWAGVPANFNTSVPQGMELLMIPAGMYAVFLYRGLPTEAAPFYRRIFTEWLPVSPYTLDHRPHFAVMDHRYKNNAPDSEEEIWIPVIEE